MKADCHTHSIFSSDGELSIEKMTAIALEKGLSYLAVTDHVDFDAQLEKNRAPSYWKQPDTELYAATVQRLKPAAADKGLYLAFGAEMGFDADPAAQRPAKELIESTPFDVIINSVHFAGGLDLYFPEYFKGRTKKQAYELTGRLVGFCEKHGIDYAVDVYPHYSSDVSAMRTAGADVAGALIGPGVQASHGMERTHLDGVFNTIKLLLAYIGALD